MSSAGPQPYFHVLSPSFALSAAVGEGKYWVAA
jgi:hypothetical protein